MTRESALEAAIEAAIKILERDSAAWKRANGKKTGPDHTTYVGKAIGILRVGLDCTIQAGTDAPDRP